MGIAYLTNLCEDESQTLNEYNIMLLYNLRRFQIWSYLMTMWYNQFPKQVVLHCETACFTMQMCPF